MTRSPAKDRAVSGADLSADALRGARVLVMDDEETVRNAVGAMLTRLDFEPEFASEGAEAVERYEQALADGRPFAAVIVDLCVKVGLGGRKTVERLLAIDPEAKCIASSGQCPEPSTLTAWGFKGGLTKPYGTSDLRRVLEDILGPG